jgi:hypothetical protein
MRIRFTRYGWSANPAHYLDPEIFDELDTRVQLSKEVKAVFEIRKKTGSWPTKKP